MRMNQTQIECLYTPYIVRVHGLSFCSEPSIVQGKTPLERKKQMQMAQAILGEKT